MQPIIFGLLLTSSSRSLTFMHSFNVASGCNLLKCVYVLQGVVVSDFSFGYFPTLASTRLTASLHEHYTGALQDKLRGEVSRDSSRPQVTSCKFQRATNAIRIWVRPSESVNL
ncbi:hypothetical protein BGZ60DRAFT_407679 [Tricladium varicosporioides]|nr:hypothetical protein BGZ60DRAFT_407679 [Hymenoscyphus varicosporioides]